MWETPIYQLLGMALTKGGLSFSTVMSYPWLWMGSGMVGLALLLRASGTTRGFGSYARRGHWALVGRWAAGGFCSGLLLYGLLFGVRSGQLSGATLMQSLLWSGLIGVQISLVLCYLLHNYPAVAHQGVRPAGRQGRHGDPFTLVLLVSLLGVALYIAFG